MSICRCLALVAALLAMQCVALSSAQAASIQPTELQARGALTAVRWPGTTPMAFELENALAFNRVVASRSSNSNSNFQAIRIGGALDVYGAALNDWRLRDGQSATGQVGLAIDRYWRTDGRHWQYDELPGSWHWHAGNWYSSDFDHHGHIAQDGAPPAVPIPATAWLLGGGLALLACMRRSQRTVRLAPALALAVAR